jgi:hypothetical protein
MLLPAMHATNHFLHGSFQRCEAESNSVRTIAVWGGAVHNKQRIHCMHASATGGGVGNERVKHVVELLDEAYR